MLIQEARLQDGFQCKLLINDIDLVGVVFGYSIPKKDTKSVAFSKIFPLLKGISWENSFYLAEAFIIQKYQNQGLGTLLQRELLSSKDKLIFRTINPFEIKALERAKNSKVQELFYDPVKIKRVWYGIE